MSRSRIFNPIDWIKALFGRRKAKDFVDAEGDIRGDAINAYSQAKGIVKRITGRAKDKKCRVNKIPGGRKIKGLWAWQDPRFGSLWIAGMYWPGSKARVDVGVDPKTDKGWSLAVLLHEFVHHFLFMIGIRTHDPRFDDHVPGWADTRKAGLPFTGIAGWSKLHKRPVVFIRQIHRYGNGDDDIVMVDVIAEEVA